VFEDGHAGERVRERLTVLELAEEHLRHPGFEGVPCARTVMAELRDAVARARGEDPPQSRTRRDDPVFLVKEVVAEMRLHERGTVFRNAHCREVHEILRTRLEVQIGLDDATKNVEAITVPNPKVGVTALRPTARCRAFLERRLRQSAPADRHRFGRRRGDSLSREWAAWLERSPWQPSCRPSRLSSS
jgi:hypothetical protein